mmetsp:Transcript_106573/g.308846  ORF Transcript_106573/g.308846 Transcript_106573/m.308846 type:complete len:500 (+) Transcript_106573:228-1727(+)
MYMPSGSCSSPVAADVYGGGSCKSYCSSASSDCSVCPSDTYYEDYSTNTACDECASGSAGISDDGSDASAHDEAEDCIGDPTPLPTPLPTPATPAPTTVPTATAVPTGLPSSTPTSAPSLLPTVSPVPTPRPSPLPSQLPSAQPTPLPTSPPSPLPTTPRPSPLPTLAPTVSDLTTLSATVELSGLDASSVDDDDISALKTGLASVIAGVSASNIDNIVVTDASTRRLGAVIADATTATQKSRRRLATAASVAFDISLSTSASASFTDPDAFEEAVTADLQDAQTDSSDFVTAIQDAATSTTFDAVPTSSAVTLGAIIKVTRPPTIAPSPEPTAMPSPSPTVDHLTAYVTGIDDLDRVHYAFVFGTTALITLFAVFVYCTHPSKQKIGAGDCAVVIFAWMDMAGDACFVQSLYYRRSLSVRIGDLQREANNIPEAGLLDAFFVAALLGMVIPTLFQTYFVVQLIQEGSRKQWLDTKRLPKHSTITVIMLCFTDPDAVVI